MTMKTTVYANNVSIYSWLGFPTPSTRAALRHLNQAAMAEFKHLVVAKFKEGVVVEELLKGMEKLVSEIDAVKSFEWGQDIESQEMLSQGFTHAFLMTFKSKEEFTAFVSHPKHVEFSATFSTVIEKVVLLDFPTVLVKPPA